MTVKPSFVHSIVLRSECVIYLNRHMAYSDSNCHLHNSVQCQVCPRTRSLSDSLIKINRFKYSQDDIVSHPSDVVPGKARSHPFKNKHCNTLVVQEVRN